MKPTVEIATGVPSRRNRGLRILIGSGVALLGALAVGLSFMGSHHREKSLAPITDGGGGEISSGRKIDVKPSTAPTAQVQPQPATDTSAEKRRQLEQQLKAEQDAQEAKYRSDQLAAKQRELDQLAADQAAEARRVAAEQASKAKALADQQARLEAENQRILEAKLEADKAAEKLRAGTRAQPRYDGPSSGTIVWQGSVKGSTLVTIDAGQPDQGQVVSGALPGVLVLLQPADSKHVVIATSPSPSNGYKRLTLRVQGNGVVQESIKWSIP